MRALESNLTTSGLTTMPKALRDALAVPHGGRLVWALMPDGTMHVRLKCAYPERTAPKASIDQA